RALYQFIIVRRQTKAQSASVSLAPARVATIPVDRSAIVESNREIGAWLLRLAVENHAKAVDLLEAFRYYLLDGPYYRGLGWSELVNSFNGLELQFSTDLDQLDQVTQEIQSGSSDPTLRAQLAQLQAKLQQDGMSMAQALGQTVSPVSAPGSLPGP